MTGDVAIADCEQADLWNGLSAMSGVPAHGLAFNAALRASGIDPKLARLASGDGRLIMPFCRRQFQGVTDIATMLCVSGASLQGEAPTLLAEWREAAAARGWAAGYLQFADCGIEAQCFASSSANRLDAV